MALPPTRFIQGPPALPQASIGAAIAQGQAVAKVGDSIQQAAGVASTIVQRIRQADDAGTRAAFMANANKEAADFSNSLLSRQDYKQWGQDWQDRYSKLQEKAKALDLSPEGMADLNDQLLQWGTSRQIQFETQAATRTVTESKAQIANSLSYAASRNDQEGMKMAKDEARKSGLFGDSELQKIDQETDRVGVTAQATQFISSDPQAAKAVFENSEEFLQNNPGATEQDRQRWLQQAEGQIQDNRRDEYDKIKARAIRGDLDVQSIENSKYLDEADKASLKRSLDKEQPIDIVDSTLAWRYADVLRDARKTQSRQEYRDTYNEYRAKIDKLVPINSTTPTRQDIDKELNYLSPAGDAERTSPTGPFTMNDLEGVSRDITRRAFDAGSFGSIDDPVAKESAARKKESIDWEVKRKINSSKTTPTPEQVQEWTDQAISGDRVSNSAIPPLRSILAPSSRTGGAGPWGLRQQDATQPGGIQNPNALPSASAPASNSLLGPKNPSELLDQRLDGNR